MQTTLPLQQILQLTCPASQLAPPLLRTLPVKMLKLQRPPARALIRPMGMRTSTRPSLAMGQTKTRWSAKAVIKKR